MQENEEQKGIRDKENKETKGRTEMEMNCAGHLPPKLMAAVVEKDLRNSKGTGAADPTRGGQVRRIDKTCWSCVGGHAARIETDPTERRLKDDLEVGPIEIGGVLLQLESTGVSNIKTRSPSMDEARSR